MFEITEEAQAYIWLQGNAVTVSMKFRPALAAGAGRILAGCLEPRVCARECTGEEKALFREARAQGVPVYYHPDLGVRLGCKKIRIILKTLMWFSWLELEGARVVAVFHPDETV
jgi:hypothetical protein